jgi:hypothetical protein
MRRRSIILGIPLLLTLGLSACSPSAPPAPGQSAPPTAELGSPSWQQWVGQTLSVDDPDRGGPRPGSPAWNAAVQQRLGQEAPAYPPGSPQWQQAVDGLLRTRAATAP